MIQSVWQQLELLVNNVWGLDTKLNFHVYFVTYLVFQERFRLLIFSPLQLSQFKRQSHKMVKHIQTIRQQFADELFEYV